MYYNEFGNPECTTIVLLHNRANINSLYKLYSLQKNYHIVIPHINGNGEEINTDYSYKSATLDINTLIQSLHKDKVILIGHGMGADLILPILLKSPQFIEKVILISPDLFFINNNNIRTVKFKYYLMKSWILCGFYGLFYGFNGNMLKDFVEYSHFQQKNNFLNMHFDYGNTTQLLKSLSAVNIPVNIIFGNKDNQAIKSTSEIIAQNIINSSVEMINGKNLPLKQSDTLLTVINKILEEK